MSDTALNAAPPVPVFKRLYQRAYSPRERVAINLALVLLIAGGMGFGLPRNDPRLSGGDFALVNWGIVVVGSAAFLIRNRLRWPAFVLTLILAIGSMNLRLPQDAFIYMVFCLYGVVCVSGQRTSAVIGALVGVLMIVAALVGGNGPKNPILNVIIGSVSIVMIGWLAGENTRATRIYARYRAEREAVEAAAEEAERAERTRRTIADERVTIARELHDIVAHSMSVVAVRSGVARMVLDSQPEEAAEALSIIETTARRSLAEMRMMVSMLRHSGAGKADLGPLPGLGDLDRLVLQLAAADVDVDVVIEGDARPLPAAADLTAYRIVQEALTNVVRHAGPTSASVTLRFTPDRLDIEVANVAPGGGVPALNGTGPGHGTGHGLLGMRERAAMLGGTLQAGPDAAGFRVSTSLRIDG